MPRRSPIGAPLAGLAALVAVPLALGACATGPSHATMSPESTRIATIVEQQMQELSLRAVIVEVGVGDELVLSRAWGESMTGVPATTDMHFRNGAVAFAYVSNLLMQYVDAGAVALDDTIDEWFPELPAADVVTLRMLANQTSGYPDFEKDPAWNAAYNDDPFQEFGFQERLDTAFSKPLQFEPGTNWSYSHTNFMILGEILAAVGGAPLDELLAAKVLGPLGLTGTSAHDSAFIPEPVLHAYTSERRVALGIPAGVAFTEESTYWNPVWGTPTGAAQTTTIGDLTRTAAIRTRATGSSARSAPRSRTTPRRCRADRRGLGCETRRDRGSRRVPRFPLRGTAWSVLLLARQHERDPARLDVERRVAGSRGRRGELGLRLPDEARLLRVGVEHLVEGDAHEAAALSAPPESVLAHGQERRTRASESHVTGGIG